jgi:hypothetical protein
MTVDLDSPPSCIRSSKRRWASSRTNCKQECHGHCIAGRWPIGARPFPPHRGQTGGCLTSATAAFKSTITPLPRQEAHSLPALFASCAFRPPCVGHSQLLPCGTVAMSQLPICARLLNEAYPRDEPTIPDAEDRCFGTGRTPNDHERFGVVDDDGALAFPAKCSSGRMTARWPCEPIALTWPGRPKGGPNVRSDRHGPVRRHTPRVLPG